MHRNLSKNKIAQKPPQRFIKAVLLNAAFYAKALSALLYAKNDPKTYKNAQGRKFSVVFGKYSSNSAINKCLKVMDFALP